MLEPSNLWAALQGGVMRFWGASADAKDAKELAKEVATLKLQLQRLELQATDQSTAQQNGPPRSPAIEPPLCVPMVRKSQAF